MFITTKGNKRKRERRWYRRHWNTWFAWRPIVIHVYKDGSKEWAWLVKVERKGKNVKYKWTDISSNKQWMICWEWEYKLLGKKLSDQDWEDRKVARHQEALVCGATPF